MELGVSDWVFLCCTLLGLVVYYFWRFNQFFKDRGIKHVSPALVMGNMWPVYSGKVHMAQFLEDSYKQFTNDRYFGAFNFTTPVVVVKDPETLKKIMVKDFEHFVDHMPFSDAEVDPLTGRSLFSLNGDEWREMRATLSPAFTSSKLRGMIPFIEECTNNLVDYINQQIKKSQEQGKEILELEVKEPYSRFTNDVLASCAFGIKINSLEDRDNEFYKMARNLTQISVLGQMRLLLYLLLPSIMRWFKIQVIDPKLTKYFKHLISENIAQREKENIVRPDMLHLLMLAKKGSLEEDTATEAQASDANGFATAKDQAPSINTKKIKLSDDDIMAQVVIFLFGGLETVATVLSFFTHEICLHPEVQETLRREVDAVMQRSGGRVDYQQVQQMKYLDMVLSESMRLWPATANLDRLCVKPYDLPPQCDAENLTSIKLQTGDLVWIPFFSIQRDPQHFPEPLKFDPERFSDANKDSIKPFTYFPFGSGPRSCIASRFALIEVKIAILKLMWNFEFVQIPKTPVPLVLKPHLFDMVAIHGSWVGVKPRQH